MMGLHGVENNCWQLNLQGEDYEREKARRRGDENPTSPWLIGD